MPHCNYDTCPSRTNQGNACSDRALNLMPQKEAYYNKPNRETTELELRTHLIASEIYCLESSRNYLNSICSLFPFKRCGYSVFWAIKRHSVGGSCANCGPIRINMICSWATASCDKIRVNGLHERMVTGKF